MRELFSKVPFTKYRINLKLVEFTIVEYRRFLTHVIVTSLGFPIISPMTVESGSSNLKPNENAL